MRRMRITRVLAVWSVVAMAGLSAAARQPRFGASTDLVVVPAVVLDRHGQDVTTLTRDDFSVFEDGQPVDVDVFVAPESSDAESGRFVVVVVDNVHTPPDLMWRAKSMALRLVQKVGPTDRMAVLALSGGHGFDTSNTVELRAAVDRIAPAAGADIRTAGETATEGLDQLSTLADRLVASPHRRKVMVVVGAPDMFSPRDASAFADRDPDLSPAWRTAIERLGSANVSLHVVDPRGFQGRANDFEQTFAASTGGVAWASNDIGRVVDRIWRDAGIYYLLGYRPLDTTRRAHAITVRTRVPEVTVRARRIRR